MATIAEDVRKQNIGRSFEFIQVSLFNLCDNLDNRLDDMGQVEYFFFDGSTIILHKDCQMDCFEPNDDKNSGYERGE